MSASHPVTIFPLSQLDKQRHTLAKHLDEVLETLFAFENVVMLDPSVTEDTLVCLKQRIEDAFIQRFNQTQECLRKKEPVLPMADFRIPLGGFIKVLIKEYEIVVINTRGKPLDKLTPLVIHYPHHLTILETLRKMSLEFFAGKANQAIIANLTSVLHSESVFT